MWTFDEYQIEFDTTVAESRPRTIVLERPAGITETVALTRAPGWRLDITEEYEVEVAKDLMQGQMARDGQADDIFTATAADLHQLRGHDLACGRRLQVKTADALHAQVQLQHASRGVRGLVESGPEGSEDLPVLPPLPASLERSNVFEKVLGGPASFVEETEQVTNAGPAATRPTRAAGWGAQLALTMGPWGARLSPGAAQAFSALHAGVVFGRGPSESLAAVSGDSGRTRPARLVAGPDSGFAAFTTPTKRGRTGPAASGASAVVDVRDATRSSNSVSQSRPSRASSCEAQRGPRRRTLTSVSCCAHRRSRHCWQGHAPESICCVRGLLVSWPGSSDSCQHSASCRAQPRARGI